MRIDTQPHTPAYVGPAFSASPAEISPEGVQMFRAVVFGVYDAEAEKIVDKVSDKRFPSYGEAFEFAHKASRNFGRGLN